MTTLNHEHGRPAGAEPMKLLGRKSDCSEYWKEPHRPSDEVQDFLRAWRAGMR